MKEKILDLFTRDALETARANNTYRSMRLMETPESSCVKIRMPDGTSQEQILLASNSYLDLANIGELKQAMAQAVLEWGTGSGEPKKKIDCSVTSHPGEAKLRTGSRVN